MENDDNFDQLVDLHDHIKDFKTKVAQKVLLNFYKEVPNTEGPNAPKLAKFVKVSDYNRENDVKDEDVLNLSSSATCAYTVGEYLTLWEEANQRNAPDNFFDLTSYWNYIVKGLREPVESELQLPDEFSILNILSLLTKIENRIETSTLGKVLTDEEASIVADFSKHYAQDKKEALYIVEALCRRFIENQFSAVERGIHPVIFYKFLIILEDWKPLLDEYSIEELTGAIDTKYHFRKARPKYRLKDGYYHWFLDELYMKGKYEMYRQISLYSAEDKTLFDVKKLVYSLLTVRRKRRFPNTNVVDEALRIIFKEQFVTGLLPVGLIVNNEFVKKNLKNPNNQVEFENREIITSPILSSFECFSDMLSGEDIREDLKKYYRKFELAFNWAQMRIRKIAPENNYLGWFPEYESTHVPESWVCAHILLFLKKYCEFLSELISDSSLNWLQAKKIVEGTTQLCQSFGITEHINYMANHEECRSALLFGPPGCGKSVVGKHLCSILSQKEKINWDYIELTPAMFLSKGHASIMPQANEIFKRLTRVKRAVVFFKEVDEFQKSHEESGSAWFVSDFVARFADLIKHKHIKLVLASQIRCSQQQNLAPATSGLLGIDPSLVRLGTISLVQPVGGVNWYHRLRMLQNTLNSIRTATSTSLALELSDLFQETDKEAIKTKIRNFNSSDHDNPLQAIKNYLQRTNYVSRARLSQILEAIFNTDDKELYDTFFANNPSTSHFDFEELELSCFQDLMKSGILSDYIRFSPKNMTKEEVLRLSAENIFP